MLSRFTSAFQQLPPRTRAVVATAIYGAAAGVTAVAFHLAIHAVYTHGIERLAHESVTTFLVGSLVIMLVSSALSGWLLTAFCPAAAGSGIPQVKLAFWKDMGFIPWRVVWVKFIGGVVAVGGGASLGREGPSVQLASGVTSTVAGWLGEPKHNRRLAAATGAAAGLAAAFNTPIAAVTFVLEEIIGDLNSRLLGGVLFASVLGAVVAHVFLGEQPSFTLHSAGSPEWFVYLLTPIVAALAAFAGVWFHRFALGLRARNKTWTSTPPWVRTTAGGLAVWVLGVGVFLATGHLGVFSLGYDDLSLALDGKMLWYIALLLLVTKLMATSIVYGLGGCGGIFAPTLFFGGMCGAAFAGLVGKIVPLTAADQVTLAVVGMGACLGAVVRAPVTGILIVFEMTHEFAFVPTLVIAGLVSVAIARRFIPHNFYDEILAQDGQQVEHVMPPRDLQSWQETPVSRVANFRPVVVEDLSPAALSGLLARVGHERFPVVQGGRLAGILSRPAAETAIRAGIIPTVEPAQTCRRDTTIREVQRQLIESPNHLVVVIGGENEQVIGLVTLHDVLRAELVLAKSS